MTTVAAPVSHLRENPFEIAQQQLHRVADTFKIDPNLIAVLQECKKAVVVSVPVRHGRRHGQRLRGLPRDAQHRARPVEGRYPLPPGRHARRGEGALDVDDVEVRADEHPVRRREGRHRLRPEEAFGDRAPEDDPPLHVGDHQRDRAGEGHPGARRRHGRARDGLDLRHVLDEQGPLGARRRDREAADHRRLARAARGDRPRRALHHPRGRPEAGRDDRGPARRRPGLRQRRHVPRAVPRTGGRHRARPPRTRPEASTTRTASTSRPRSRTSRRRARSPASRTPRRSPTRSCSSSSATCSHRARSSR